MDPEDAKIAKDVREHGWHAVSVPDTSPPFVYTCGLQTTFSHPELIVFGLEGQLAYGVLAAMVEDVRKGRSFVEPQTYLGVLEEGMPIATRSVHPSQHEIYLGYAMAHCRIAGKAEGLEALQVLWPDKSGAFPFDRNCEAEARACQPQLDQATD
jgi:hypothetical protein